MKNEPRDRPRKLVVKAMELMGAEVGEEAIDICHRKIGGSIIILFRNRTARDEVYSKRMNLKGYTTKDLDIPVPAKGNRLYMNESLTFGRAKLMADIRSRMKLVNADKDKDTMYKVSTGQGKIYVMDKNREFQVIWSLNELARYHPETARL